MVAWRSAALAALALVLAACTVGPDYHPPDVARPAVFGELPAAAQGAAPSRAVGTSDPVVTWWRTFGDPQLDDLVDAALRENLDLQIAASRIRQARAERAIAVAGLFPQVAADAGYARALGSENVVLPFGAAAGTGGGGSTASGGPARAQQLVGGPRGAATSPFADVLSPLGKGGLPGVTTNIYQAGFDASWELDVFGGRRRRIEEATANVEVAEENGRGAVLSLLAEVARTYLELRGAQQRIAVARANVEAEKQILDVTRSAYRSGLASDLDVTRAAAQLDGTEASIPPLETGARRSIHELSILLDEDPTALASTLETPKPVPTVPPEVPVGLPSQLLRRRPDVRAAERQIAAATARVGVATADLFPKFALTGSVGLDSSKVTNLFDWQSRYFLVNPAVTWPVFEAGRIVANVHLREEGAAEALLSYRKAVLAALRDVEDALVAYRNAQARRAALERAVAQSRQARELAGERYDKGLADFLVVLDAQRTTLELQDGLAQADQSVATTLVSLYKALGGGWQTAAPAAPG